MVADLVTAAIFDEKKATEHRAKWLFLFGGRYWD